MDTKSVSNESLNNIKQNIMSSYICSNKHFESIKKSIVEVLKNDRFNSYELKPFNLYSYEVVPNQVESIVDSLISSLGELNVLCVSLQYKKHYEGRLNEEIETNLKQLKQKVKGIILTPLGLLNALNCVSYQIELHHLKELRTLTEKENLAFEFLGTFTNVLAKYICSILPEDESNSWEVN